MENQNTSAMPLDQDLNTIDTSFPLIANGSIVDFTINKVEKKQNASKVDMLAIELKSATPTTSVKGDQLLPGVTVFHNINLAPSGKATSQMVSANIAEYAQALGLSGTLGAFINGGYMATQGQTIRASVNYVPEGPDKKGVMRKAKNEIGRFMKQ